MEKDFDITSSIKEKIKSLTSGNSDATKTAISNLKETESETKKPEDYLIHSDDMNEIYLFVKKNKKKLSANKIKEKIKEFLKEPSELKAFLRSILDSKSKKIENKEAMASGGGVGAFEGPISGEFKEATTSSSAGVYDAPGFQNVKMKGNTPKGKGKSWRKTQIPGGKFVQVKKKCKRFPYCNQGDIKALNIFENEMLKEKIKSVSEKYDVHQDFIMEIIYNEMLKRNIT